jgi:hypothetical protein
MPKIKVKISMLSQLYNRVKIVLLYTQPIHVTSPSEEAEVKYLYQ